MTLDWSSRTPGFEARTVREQLEAVEDAILAPYAVHSARSKGRERTEPESELRTAFQRDRDRIVHANSFKRLRGKTQVFMAPVGDHFSTRLSHVLEVSQVARVTARALRLNEDLVEAIALAHDLGHAPFGHAGQAALDEELGDGYSHDEQSLRLVRHIERDGRGLNLSIEVLDGIRTHRKPRHNVAGVIADPTTTLEAEVVKISDAIAYVNHDLDDAFRAQVISQDDMPVDAAAVLGRTRSERINTAVRSIVETSRDRPVVHMRDDVLDALNELREFLFRTVYTSTVVKHEAERARHVVRELFRYFRDHASEMPDEYQQDPRNEGADRRAADYIAGMTDSFAIQVFQDLFVPKVWAL